MSLITILVFVICKGHISNFLSKSRILNKFGKLNLEFYLLHQPIIKYYEFIYQKLNIINPYLSVFIIFVIFVNLYLISVIIHEKLFTKKIK